MGHIVFTLCQRTILRDLTQLQVADIEHVIGPARWGEVSMADADVPLLVCLDGESGWVRLADLRERSVDLLALFLVGSRVGPCVESRGREAESELRADELVADLNEMAAHSSAQAEVAQMAAYAVADLKVCQFMDPHVGETLKAKVLRVSPSWFP